MKSLNYRKDIEAASNIIENPYAYENGEYKHYSKIFNLPTINHKKLYEKMGNNWYDYLGVIGSFDPALNAIIKGSRNITVFDINCFNVYYAYLKLAGILALTYEEFLEYFYAVDLEKFCSKYYFDKLKTELPSEILKYWEYLYNTYNSVKIQNLFYTIIEDEKEIETIIKQSVIPSNIFLQEKEFYRLKQILTQIKFKYYICDFGELPKIVKNEKFDIIYLSCLHNFIYDNVHGYNYLEKLKEYETLLKNGGTLQSGYIYWNQMEDEYHWCRSLIMMFRNAGFNIEELQRFEFRPDLKDFSLLKKKK